jgi:hippurate hydrolase
MWIKQARACAPSLFLRPFFPPGRFNHITGFDNDAAGAPRYTARTMSETPIRRNSGLLLLVLLGFSAGSFSVQAADNAPLPRAEISAIVEKEYPSLEQLYLSIHREPELSLLEEKTSHRLAEQLRQAGFTVTEGVGGHGVVAVLENGKGKTLLIRTDLDALPVKEETDAPYASRVQAKDAAGNVVPVMHACGHDIHIATIAGVARTLSALKSQWKGTLVLIGQPAEEVGKGAKAMLQDGLFTRFPRPDYALALHVDSDLETGKVGYVSGFAMANVDSIDITIRGIGGHGAHPEKTKDPIVIAAQTIVALQTIASREIAAAEAVVVTVGSIHGGSKHNIIPNEVKLQLTVRTYKDEVRATTLAAIERIVKGTALAAGVPKELEPIVTIRDDEFTPATYNTPELVERVTRALRQVIGTENVVPREPSMGGEDFSRYGREEPRIPIFMYRLGSVAPEVVAESKRLGKPLPGLHSSRYLPQPVAIKTGVLTMTAAAIDLLK